MSYTLAKWALWLISAAVAGFVVGWMLRGLRRAPAGEPADRGAEVADPAELARLRARVDYLEPVAADTDRLRRQVEEYRVLAASAQAASAQTPVEAFAADGAVAAERDRLAALATAHEATIGELRARLWNHEAKIGELRSLLATQHASTAPPDPNVDEGSEVLGEKIRLNDLTVLEGIGPKIANLLQTNDIKTWWQLYLTDVGALRSLLESAGPRFQVHDPGSWPQQAGLLARGEWQQFKALTDALRGGRRSE
ncbi:MAG: hypothetical protein Q8M22_06680 [Actinomycetota bacterium]|nr:hypothetical protein [Actinomycetota bacterium]